MNFIKIIFCIIIFVNIVVYAQNYKNKDIDTMEKINISSTQTIKEKEEQKVLNLYKKFQQAMIDKDITLLDIIVKEDTVFTHMSGRQQTKDEFFKEIKDGTLNYYKYEIKNPVIKFYGNYANLKSVTTLTAKVYGMSGKWSLNTDAWFIKTETGWLYCNKPKLK